MPTFDYLFWDGDYLMGHTVGEDVVIAKLDYALGVDAAEFVAWIMKHAEADGLMKGTE